MTTSLSSRIWKFLSTPSARRATPRRWPSTPPCRFLSTPSARRATPSDFYPYVRLYISIHALCEEGDGHQDRFSRRGGLFLSTPSARRATRSGQGVGKTALISIHALCEEGDRRVNGIRDYFNTFLSTPSARRATERLRKTILDSDISIHALCEEGDCHRAPGRHGEDISIHALCEEGDFRPRRCSERAVIFLSTPSARRATADKLVSKYTQKFLSTPSARRATGRGCNRSFRHLISIHALCEEGDGAPGGALQTPPDFYPRPLRGGRRCPIRPLRSSGVYFYPRPLRGGRPSMKAR